MIKYLCLELKILDYDHTILRAKAWALLNRFRYNEDAADELIAAYFLSNDVNGLYDYEEIRLDDEN